MTYKDFHHALRILNCLNPVTELLPCINKEDREYFGDQHYIDKFARSPFRTFMELPTQDSERIYAIIERKNAR